jgi:hypothetical protein
MTIKSADGAGKEIDDALGFCRCGVIELEQHAMALADGLHRLLGVAELAAAQDRDLREPHPKRCAHAERCQSLRQCC